MSDSLQPDGLHTLGFLVNHQVPELVQTHIHQVGNAIQPSHPSVVPFFSCIQSSQHQGFSKDSVQHIRWPRYWSFTFSIRSCNEYSGLISFRIDWFDLLVVQGTLKSLLQHHSSKHQFFGAQLSLWSNSHSWQSCSSDYGPFSAKQCLCFLTHFSDLSQLFFQGAMVWSLTLNQISCNAKSSGP